MTDKRIKSYLEDRLKRLESIRNEREWTTSELGDITCCKQTLAFIDTLQEEPAGLDKGKLMDMLEDSLSKETKDSWNERLRKEEPVSSIWHDASEPPIIDKTFLLVAPNGNSSLCLWGGKDLHSVTIGGGHSVLCKGDIYSYIDDLLNLDNSCNFGKNLQEGPVSGTQSPVVFYGLTGSVGNTKEEPVSEDLEEAADNCYYHNHAYAKESFIEGAQWKKEQMMKDAIEAIVEIDAGGYPYINRTIEMYDYDKDQPLAKKGDKVKVIVIKED